MSNCSTIRNWGRPCYTIGDPSPGTLAVFLEVRILYHYPSIRIESPGIIDLIVFIRVGNVHLRSSHRSTLTLLQLVSQKPIDLLTPTRKAASAAFLFGAAVVSGMWYNEV